MYPVIFKKYNYIVLEYVPGENDKKILWELKKLWIGGILCFVLTVVQRQ